MRTRFAKIALAAVVMLSLALAACSKPTTSQTPQTPQTPTAPAAETKPKSMTVLIRMMDAQDKFFRENVLAKFEKEKGVKLNVVVFDQEADVIAMVKLEQDSGNKSIGLIKTAETVVNPLVARKYMMPLKDIVGAEQLAKDLNEYTKLAVDFGTIEGTTYYIPRKLETNTMLYLKSKVAEAAQNWKKYETQLNEAVKKHNGYGLPNGYNLEADPNQWDWYDLLAAGYYWANTEYGGMKGGKIAHRTRKYEGTTSELYTKILQVGGTKDDLLRGDTQAIADTLAWEGLQQELGVYNKQMLTEAWTGGGIWTAFSQGQVFLAFMHQIDAFFVHGGTHPTMQGYLKDPGDMGIALMPAGVSFEMKPDGTPARTGGHNSAASGWWWGIPVTTPDAKLSYELARYITNYENHLAESKTFGMMPIRKDVLEKMDTAYDQPWMREVFQAANKQLSNAPFKPIHASYPQISAELLEQYYTVAINGGYKKDGKVDMNAVKAAMAPHAAKIKSISGVK